jgi:hypothetical protein
VRDGVHDVALKISTCKLDTNSEAFTREVALLKSCRNSNIVQVNSLIPLLATVGAEMCALWTIIFKHIGSLIWVLACMSEKRVCLCVCLCVHECILCVCVCVCVCVCECDVLTHLCVTLQLLPHPMKLQRKQGLLNNFVSIARLIIITTMSPSARTGLLM